MAENGRADFWEGKRFSNCILASKLLNTVEEWLPHGYGMQESKEGEAGVEEDGMEDGRWCVTSKSYSS